MPSVRTGALLVAVTWCGVAGAQPVDPYAPAGPATPRPVTPAAPTPAPAPPPTPAPATPAPAAIGASGDPILAEQIAQQLVARAQELLDQRVWVDAKQLAVEALVESPQGGAADHARAIIKAVNAQLGIVEEAAAPPPPPVVQTPPPDLRPIEDPTKHVDNPEPVPGAHDPTLAAVVHGGIYGAMVGSMIGAIADSNHPAGPAVGVGLIGAGALAFATPKLVRMWGWDEARTRAVGSGIMWGGVIGGLFADAVAGASNGVGPAPSDASIATSVLVGVAIGGSLGLLTASAYDKKTPLTRGDVALVDTFTGMGVAGGIALGFLMQPAQAEAYSLNAALGGAAGLVVGLVAAPKTNTTPRRMLRVAGLAAAGGAAPLLIIAASRNPGPERAAGALSMVGLVGGAWLGFYLTRDMDKGLDVLDAPTLSPNTLPPAQQAPLPPATPLTNQPAAAFPILAGTF